MNLKLKTLALFAALFRSSFRTSTLPRLKLNKID